MSAGEYIHGLHAVRALLKRDPSRLRNLWVARGRDDARIAEVLQRAAEVGCAVQRVDAEQLSRRVGGAAVHQGLVAEVMPLPPWREDDLNAALLRLQAMASATSPFAPLLLALDGVQDPHNLGACLRTADACGALAVIIPKDRAVQMNATVRKVAAGAAESTPVAVVTNLSRCLRELKEHGFWVVGAAAEAPATAASVDLRGPTVLVMGAEGSGLRQNTRQHCDLLVRLPSLGAVESLNVSVAAGMLLYEATRQRLGVA
jgi:23S rRNA (guanosine2251-2'-O)-methyltransferase